MAAIVTGSILVAAAGLLLGITNKLGPLQIISHVVAFAVFISGVVLLMSVKCPKCSVRLGQAASGAAYGYRGWVRRGRRKVNFCPFCGVSLDEPVPQKPVT